MLSNLQANRIPACCTTSCHSEKLRQDKQARKQDQHLPGEGKEYRFACHAYALEKVGSHHLETDNREEHYRNTQSRDRKLCQFRIRCKDAHHQVRHQHTDQKAESGHCRGIDYRQSQHLVHPSVQLRPKVISGNRLHSLIQPHHNHHYNENQTVHDAESPDSQVAAILLQPLIDNDNDEAGCQVHQERRDEDDMRMEKDLLPIASDRIQSYVSDGISPGGNATARPIAEKLELPRQRDDLRHNGSDGSATYAPAETIDKHRVEYGIDNHRGYSGVHRFCGCPEERSTAFSPR